MSILDDAFADYQLADDEWAALNHSTLDRLAPRGEPIEAVLERPSTVGGDLYPLDAPGMPPPGSDMTDLVDAQLGAVADRCDTTRLTGRDSMLERLYQELLYSAADVHIPISLNAHRKRRLSVVTGHRWLTDGAVGPTPSRVMIISKMLGDEEQRAGRRFVGAGGQLLTELCERLQLPDYREWYVTSVLKTVHPQAEFGNTTLKACWTKEFMPLLHQELRLVRPKYIVCMGADALKALLGKKATLKGMAGQAMEFKYPLNRTAITADNPLVEHTALVMACTHPAAVLATPELEPQLENELARFGRLIRGFRPDQVETDLDHRQIDSLAELQALFREIERDCVGNMISIDAEWHGEHPQNDGAYLRSIQLSWKPKSAVHIHVTHPGGAWRFRGTQQQLAEWVTKICRGRRVIGQFLAADFEWLIPFGIDLRKEFGVAETWDETAEQALRRDNPQGGFDVGLALHAFDETADLSLTAQTLRFTSAPRYDLDLVGWRDKYCNQHGLRKEQLEGYGECPDEILVPYSCYDCDIPIRLVPLYQRLLTVDQFKNCSWEAFWVSMRAQPAVLEMGMSGIRIDRDRVDRLSEAYLAARDRLGQQIREFAKWTEMNLESPFHVREFLFGEELNGKLRTDPLVPVRQRPPGAKSLKLTPVITTDKRSMPWGDVVRQRLQDQKTPSTNKTSLAILAQDSTEVTRWNARLGRKVTYDLSQPVIWLRDYRFVSQVLKSVLRAPETDESGAFAEEDDHYVYAGGLPGAICADGRVRTRIWPTKETRRWSTTRPPLQNWAKRRESDYARILGDLYCGPIRSMAVASPGYVLVDVDYVGAELLGMAIMSGDVTMIDHARRGNLPEDHPNYYDIHSNVAVMAFQLPCPPAKAGLKAIGKIHLRTVAKAVIFGAGYGRGARAIALALREEGVHVSADETQRIIDAIFAMYPRLVPFFAACSERALNDRWMCGCFGGFRRFPVARDKKSAGDIERQGMNFPIQNMVADAINRAVDHLYHYREAHPLVEYRLLLQNHDALLLEVPDRHLEVVMNDVLPECMCRRVPIHPTDLAGYPSGTGPLYFGIDVEPCLAWGELMLPSEFISRQLSPALGGWKRHELGWTHATQQNLVWIGDATGGEFIVPANS